LALPALEAWIRCIARISALAVILTPTPNWPVLHLSMPPQAITLQEDVSGGPCDGRPKAVDKHLHPIRQLRPGDAHQRLAAETRQWAALGAAASQAASWMIVTRI
jgi:hypothetical protein